MDRQTDRQTDRWMDRLTEAHKHWPHYFTYCCAMMDALFNQSLPACFFPPQYDLCEHQPELLHHVRGDAAVFCGCTGLPDVRCITPSSVSDHTAAEASPTTAATVFSIHCIDACCSRHKILASVGGRHDCGAGIQPSAHLRPPR